MRQILHLFYAAIFTLIGSAGKPVDPVVKSPAFRDYHDGIWAGEISLATEEAKLQYARVHLNQAFENQDSMRFEEAMRIITANA